MGSAARRDDLLAQIRELPFEDREYIEAELTREAYERHHRSEAPDELAEIMQRAADAVAERHPSYTREESIARARAAVAAARAKS